MPGPDPASPVLDPTDLACLIEPNPVAYGKLLIEQAITLCFRSTCFVLSGTKRFKATTLRCYFESSRLKGKIPETTIPFPLPLEFIICPKSGYLPRGGLDSRI